MNKNSKLPSNTIVNGNVSRETFEIIKGNKFIVTSAQNNTSVNTKTFNNLKRLAEKLNAKLIIIPSFYNKNAFSPTAESEEERFAPELLPYLITESVWLGVEGLALVSNASIPLTAKQPANAGKQLNSGEQVTVVGNPKQQLKMIAGVKSAKIAISTGTVTTRNYIRGRAGSEASKTHAFGGFFIEIIEGRVYPQNLTANNDGDFILVPRFNGGEPVTTSKSMPTCKSIVLGDSHVEKFDYICFNDIKEWLHMLNPEILAVHDILHYESRNHHNVNSSLHWYKHKKATIINELLQVVEYLNELSNYCGSVYVVESNHNSAIDTWLTSENTLKSIRYDTQNVKLYHLLSYLLCESIDSGEDPKALQLALEKSDLLSLPRLSNNIIFGDKNESFIIEGYDISQHGHKGINGARSGLKNLFENLITGHTHTPEISFLNETCGNITVGVTAMLDQGYNRGGGSSWGQASSIIFESFPPILKFHK